MSERDQSESEEEEGGEHGGRDNRSEGANGAGAGAGDGDCTDPTVNGGLHAHPGVDGEISRQVERTSIFSFQLLPH